MRVLIVNSTDISGGAARAAYRLHQSLLMKNVDSTMLVQNKMSDDFSVVGPISKFDRAFNKLRPTLDSLPLKRYKDKSATLFSTSWVFSGNLVNQINKLNPDIVHLHWINSGMLRLEDLSKIKSKIVWSLHDMWMFTGGCHYDDDCGLYKDNCGNCPVLNSRFSHDLSRVILKRKSRAFANVSSLTVIGVSKWLQGCAEQSQLLKNRTVLTLPNPIDTTLFRGHDKLLSRRLWGLPSNKKLILFGAIGSTNDPRKGFSELIDTLKNIDTRNVAFVVFGATRPLNPPVFDCEVIYVGSLHDDVSLISLYCSVDVMVVPSRQEAFGQTASESMACGTPVVSFRHTGLLDIVDHKVNGYLAAPSDTEDLAAGIEWVLNNESYSELCIEARKKVVSKFDSKVVAEKYIEVYRGLLNE
ncbi:glycosyltransferase family 4 protein [Glaciecola sp. HTCC2999]|uniref:glycosyltransferase family 4 protein n=1 Tax=Glaciecola sp. HTCC2999 TaxID=455436 RepID=UPI0000E0F5FB|nr:glycosyltransferase family 4 protein [Glaciecola sp. HTCC2999]